MNFKKTKIVTFIIFLAGSMVILPSFVDLNSESDESINPNLKTAQALINDGLIINPGGYAHTSVAIKDALETCNFPKIEVHLSNIAARENFRQTLITASSCNGYISGFKEKSYTAAVFLLEKITHKE